MAADVLPLSCSRDLFLCLVGSATQVGFLFSLVFPFGCMFLLFSGNVYEKSTLKLMLHIVSDDKRNINDTIPPIKFGFTLVFFFQGNVHE